MLETTFALARNAGACSASYEKVAEALGGIRAYGRNTPIPLTKVMEISGLNDALWCLRCILPEQEEQRDRLARLFACDCTERVLPIYETAHPNDQRPRKAIEVSRLFANGLASAQELHAAARAAYDAYDAAARAAYDAYDAAARAAYDAAARAADAAAYAAYAAADAAARAAYAAYAADAARAAYDAYAADAATYDAEREWQTEHFRSILEGGEA